MIAASIFSNVKTVYSRIVRAAMKAERDPLEIALVAVTKTVDIERIREAIDAGLRVFGENRVQEALKKVTSDELRVASGRIEWHLIGHLQRNKVKHAVRLFNLIHSVDSAELAGEINRQAAIIDKVQDVLIEVKLSHEETKFGVGKEALANLLGAVSGMGNICLRGLMTIPPFFDNPEDSRPYFRELRELRDKAEATGLCLPELSMGMSDDFEVAIEEGATMVRVGSAIFGERR